MVEDVREVAELDLNPLMILPEGKGAVVVDARIRFAEGIQPALLSGKEGPSSRPQIN